MMPKDEITLSELSAQSGLPGRTIRLYISQGVLPGPFRAGRNAAYGPQHLELLGRIRALQKEGLTLSQIRRVLSGDSGGSEIPQGVSWRQFMVAPDVQVWVRDDVSPWRGKVIKDAMALFGNRLGNVSKEEEDIDDDC